MSHCVYTAFNHHLQHLKEPIFWSIWDTYKYCKAWTHESIHDYTFAGIVPWLYARMLQVHNRLSSNKLLMAIQIHYVPWECMLAEAGESNRKLVMQRTAFKGEQVDKVTLAPAVYCMLNQQHAMFAEKPPDWPGARIIMAIRLRKYQEKTNGRNKL